MHVRSSRYDGTVDELFDLQDRITQPVTGALQPSIRLAEVERSRSLIAYPILQPDWMVD